MDFRIEAMLPATAAQLWAIFFDVRRVAALIPGCENVVEVEPLKEFSAVMKQKVGPFRLEVPTRIVIESHEPLRQVVLVAAGTDRMTGTSIDVRMKVDLDEQLGAPQAECKLGVDASMQVAGRLASLGYPIVKKRSEDLFAEFQRRLRAELEGVGVSRDDDAAGIARALSQPAATDLGQTGASRNDALQGAADSPMPAGWQGHRQPHQPTQRAARSATGSLEASHASQSAAPIRASGEAETHRRARRTELVFVWPRVGICIAVGVAVAHGAVAFGQSPWWWLAAPLLGAAAGLDRRQG